MCGSIFYTFYLFYKTGYSGFWGRINKDTSFEKMIEQNKQYTGISYWLSKEIEKEFSKYKNMRFYILSNDPKEYKRVGEVRVKIIAPYIYPLKISTLSFPRNLYNIILNEKFYKKKVFNWVRGDISLFISKGIKENQIVYILLNKNSIVFIQKKDFEQSIKYE